MIGLVLAAGAGKRLRPYTDSLPKTLVPIRDELTILDVILSNFAAVGLTDVAVVVGYAAEVVEDLLPSLKERHGINVTLVYNDRHHWNNAYSLWLARNLYAGGALLANGDTLHPAVVQRDLLARTRTGLVLTVDSRKALTDEAMKVQIGPTGRITRITKQMLIADAYGEYIGTSLINPDITGDLTSALAATWQRDPNLYYEDGYQLLVDRGGAVVATDPGQVEWVEVDDHFDLARAREIACRS